MSKKVFFCRLSQESNSFNPDLADFSSFKIVTDGANVLTENGKAGITVNGIYKTLVKDKTDIMFYLFYYLKI